MKVLATSKSLDGLVERIKEIFGTSFVEVKGELMELSIRGETQSDLRVRKYPKGAYKLEDRSLPTIQVPIRTGFETRPYLEVPGCDAIVVTIYKQDESLRYTPTVKINGYAIAHVMKTKAAAIEWCKWVWKHLPEADRTLRVKDPDKAYKGVLEPEGAREVMKLARRMSDENWSATRIKKTASPVTLPSGGSYWAKKYREGKAAGPDTLLLFRSGDFFELFFDDAKTVAKMLGITLTTRSRMDEEPIPMAGFPVYQAEANINKLIKYGFRVAVMEG